MAQVQVDQKQSCVIVAIDFGTSYSGYAFSIDSPDSDIQVNHWDVSTPRALTNKAPTSILFRPDKTFHSFGFESEDKYAELVSDGEHEKWFYFTCFKMFLSNVRKTNRERKPWMIKDESGKELEASYVFTHALRYLRESVLWDIKQRFDLPEITDNDVTWLLTVPAIWSDVAKKFMRESAEEAGITKERLVLVYEPEVAAVWCIHKEEYLVRENKTLKRKRLDCGEKFILLDIGGGTVDISVQEVMADHKMKLLHYPVGGDKGGTTVDKKFNEMLHESLDGSELSKKKELKLMREFEFEKRNFHHLGPADFKISIPKSIKLKTVVGMELIKNRMLIKDKTFEGFFYPTLECIRTKIKEILEIKGCAKIKLIIVVGGCAESTLIQKSIRQEYGKQFHVVIPICPDLAVLKGAVLFGQCQNVITSRVCRYTYGFAVFKEFQEGFHREDKRVFRDGGLKTKDCFKKVYEIGEVVEIGQYKKIPIYDTFKTAERKAKIHDQITVTIYSSTETNPQYTDEECCERLGNMTMVPPAAGWPSEVSGYVTFEVSRTELLGKLYNSMAQFQDSCRFDFFV